VKASNDTPLRTPEVPFAVRSPTVAVPVGERLAVPTTAASRAPHMTTQTRPVVLIAEELAPSVLAVLGEGFDIRHVDGADRAALLPALAEADAVLIRSATQVDAEALAAAPAAEGRRPRRHRPRQRRRAGRDRPRRDGRQRAVQQHRERR
jgi:hypothetical protein